MLCDVMLCRVEWWHVYFVLVMKCTSQCLGHPECSECHWWFHFWMQNNKYTFLSVSGLGHCSVPFVVGRCDVLSLHSLSPAVGVEIEVPDFITSHSV